MSRGFPHAMKPIAFPHLPAFAIALLAFFVGGCASKDEIAAQRKWETYDERASREVFRSNWIMPSVSDEDRDFFYRPFLKTSNGE